MPVKSSGYFHNYANKICAEPRPWPIDVLQANNFLEYLLQTHEQLVELSY